MQGLLFGLGATIVMLMGGILASFGDPSAMFDALLAPFSSDHRRRHRQYKIDSYYQGLTKELLQSQLRSDLLADNGQGFLATDRRHVSGQHGGLRRIFDEFAVTHGQAGRKVWTEKQFTAFVSSRLGDDGAAPALWRCFCYNATYPFTNTSCQLEQQQLDMDGWTQAVALLTTDDAVRSVGRNRAQLSLYGPSHSAVSRKPCTWRRFVSFSISTGGDFAIEDDDWRPPTVLDEVASVAATQLPLGMSIRGPPLSEIRPNVEKLVDESSGAQSTTRDFMIPYRHMLSVLCAILQVSNADIPGEPFNDQSWPSLSLDVDKSSQMAVAKGILDVGGIHSDSTVSFADYLAFSERFHSSAKWPAWSFDRELTKIWRGLFSVEDSNLSPPSSSPQHPPSLVLRALDFLYPLQQTIYDLQERQQSTLVYSTDTGFSRDGVLKALTWPYSSKFVVVYGSATDAASQAGSSHTRSSTRDTETGQPAIFVIMTSSPLWSIYKTGEIDDFLVGDAHVLLELAPRPRALWHAGEQTKYADFVDITDDASISFGQGATRTAGGSGRASGLNLNFDTGVATLCSLPDQPEGRERGYVEVQVGRRDGQVEKVDKPRAWETAVQIRKIEVYSGPGGVLVGLSVRRSSRL